MTVEVSAQQAAEILSASHKTIWARVREGKLPARRQGERGLIRIELNNLRVFAQENGYRFDEELASQIEK